VEKLKNDNAVKREITAKIHNYAANVKGTDQYYNKVRRQFTATAFHSHYVDKIPARLFHTGSMAEFHDPFLRLLMSKYVSCVEGAVEGERVWEDDREYMNAMYAYKTVVTHYFAF
jgi:hypothetical protein